jgi:hypothetical protein
MSTQYWYYAPDYVEDESGAPDDLQGVIMPDIDKQDAIEKEEESLPDAWVKIFRSILCRPWITIGVIVLLLFVLAIMPLQLIEVLKLVVSWPVAIVAVAAMLGRLFKDPISKLLERNKEGELSYRGTSFKWKTVNASSVAEKAKAGNLEPTNEADSGQVVQSLRNAAQEEGRLLLKMLTSSEEEIQQKDKLLNQAADLIQMKHAQAVYWWFMYLATTFSDLAKTVLYTFYLAESGLTLTEFEEKISPVISNDDERRSIVQLLLYYNLIEHTEAKMKITGTGRDFMTFLMSKI